jgi:hypothetical protein
MDTSSVPTFLACGAFFVLSFVTIWAFWFVERLREQTPRTCENRPSCAPHVRVPARCRLITRSCLSLHAKKSRGFLRGFVCIRLWSISPVAIGADSDANTRRADADAAPYSPRV